jgi:PhzF family phenazine biosynthesis protein
LGTAHAVIEAGLAIPKDGKMVQQCAVGLVEVSLSGSGLSFRLPRYAYEAAPEPEKLAAALGESAIKGVPEIVNVGPRWVVAELASAETVKQLQPDLQILADYDRAQSTTGMTVYAEKPDGGIVVRSFAPADGIAEDPVCGSGNGAVAAYRLKAQQVSAGSEYVASQGRQVGRDGHVRVQIKGNAVHVGGDCVTVVDGTFRI